MVKRIESLVPDELVEAWIVEERAHAWRAGYLVGFLVGAVLCGVAIVVGLWVG